MDRIIGASGDAEAGGRGLPDMVVDLSIRAVGFGGIGLAVALVPWLYRAVQAAPGREAGPMPSLVAAVAFLAASLGCGLVVLGRHVNDRIMLSERWRPLG